MITAKSEPTDAELMASVSIGEMTAVGQLYCRHARMISRVLTRIYGSGLTDADIEDLCHDTFMRLVPISSAYIEEGKFVPWLVRVARGEAQKLIRKRRWRLGLFRKFAAHSRELLVVMPDDRIRIRQQQFDQAFQKLPVNQREVLILAVGENMSGEEIAAALSIGHTAVRSRLLRARKTLKKILSETTQSTGETL